MHVLWSAWTLAGLVGLTHATTVIKEMPVTFTATDSVRFSVEVIDKSLTTETLVITLPDSTVAYRLVSTGEIIKYEDKDGQPLVLTPEIKHALEGLRFDTGWSPPATNSQLRLVYSSVVASVDVLQHGYILIEYDDADVGPGVALPTKVSWRAEPDSGALHISGNAEVMAAPRFLLFGAFFETPFVDVSTLDLGYGCDKLFNPFALGGNPVECVDTVISTFNYTWPGNCEYSAFGTITEAARGKLSGDSLCVELDGRNCIQSGSETVQRMMSLSDTTCNTTLSLSQRYGASFDINLSFDMIYSSVHSGLCFDLTNLENVVVPTVVLNWRLNPQFDPQVANFTIDGVAPVINEVLPDSGACVGDTVEILGRHFGSIDADAPTTLLGATEANIVSWENKKIRLTVPDGAGEGIRIETVCGVSVEYPFSVLANEQCSSCCELAGDANSDGKVNIADVQFVISWLFSAGEDPECFAEGSANGDEKLNIADVSYIISWLFSGGPGPVCGPAGMGR